MKNFITKIESIISNNWYPLTLGLFSFPLWCLLVAVFGFIVFIPVTKYHAIVAFALSLATIAWACHWNWKRMAWHSILFFFIISVAAGVSSFTTDRPWDGMAYHKPAAMKMVEGWNPIWEFDNTTVQNFVKDPTMRFYWTQYYSKAEWYINAVLYAFSGNPDAGQINRILYILVLFVVSFFFIKTFFELSIPKCFMLAVLIPLSPDAIKLLFLGYLDGALGNNLSILFLSLAAYLKNKDKRLLAFVGASIVIVTNMKATGVIYVGVFLISFLLPHTIIGLWNKKSLDKPLVRSLAAAAILSLVVGINPYLWNLCKHYTPFYPLQTVKENEKNQKANFMSVMEGYNVSNTDKFQQFAFAFLIPKNEYNAHNTFPPYPKQRPITINPSRLFRNATGGNMGWGDIFIIPMWFSLFVIPFLRGRDVWIFFIAVWASILVQPYIWYSRYVPHLWLIPIIVLCSLLSQSTHISSLKHRVEVIAVIILICLSYTVLQNTKLLLDSTKSNISGLAYCAHFSREYPEKVFFDIEKLSGGACYCLLSHRVIDSRLLSSLFF